MNIAIIGTRGIPNNYGGFEQFAQYLSIGLVEKGHTVYVYNSHNHLYQDKSWNGVNIIHKYDPEFKIGTAGQFIYDLNCILDSRKRTYDIILNLGYTSSSIWSFMFPKKPVLITNMDGLEWKRTKYSKKVQHFLKYAEKLAVKNSKALVADSLGIQKYLDDTYKAHSHYIAYGAELFDTPDHSVLEKYHVKAYEFNMLVARMEPENNIELILDGVHASQNRYPFLVISNYKNEFGSYLLNKYKENKDILFIGPIYDITVLNNLRYYSNIYFHGHSVGGTNPSLLEAMACKSMIAAHENIFNKSILGEDAYYFANVSDVASIIHQKKRSYNEQVQVTNNYKKIRDQYSWSKIIAQYEALMKAM